jgi:hypothetical protein
MRSFQSLLAFAPALVAAALTEQRYVPKTVIEFPNPTFVESVLATCDGHLLAGVLSRPELYSVDPFAGIANLVYTFPGKSTVMGITELKDHLYAVVAGNYTFPTPGNVPYSYSLYTVDLTNARSPRISAVVDLTNSSMLNGMTTLNSHTVLIADSRLGNIVKVDIKTREASIAIDDAALKPSGGQFDFGVDGIRFRDSYLYYTNTDQETLGRVKLDAQGSAIGTFTPIATNLTVPDDFAITDDGTIFLARDGDNLISKIALDGKVEDVVGSLNSTAVAGPTGVTLGRTVSDSDTVYVSTTGGLVFPINGNITVGGQVVSFKYR